MLWEFFQPCLGGVLVEGMCQLCLWAAEWVEARALKVLKGRVDTEPSAEFMLRAKGEGRTCMPKHLGMLMRVETAYGAFCAPSTQSLRGH